MQITTTDRVTLGPVLDLSRYVRGKLTAPPATRRLARAELDYARATLVAAGCDLSACTVANLHTACVPLPAARLFELVLSWQGWPCSAFFACSSGTTAGVGRFSYRLYGMLPIVMMRLMVVQRADLIIYEITHGIGAGGYHSFLFQQLTARETAFSIFTTFPPSWFFFEGLHDHMNYDIYRQFYQG